MQIACGKFDPELNPPPFLEWSKVFTAVEIDLFQYFSWKQNLKSHFQRWVLREGLSVIPRLSIRKQRSPDENSDAASIWMEQFKANTDYFLIHSGRKAWSQKTDLRELGKLGKSEKYFFEWGREDSLKSTAFVSKLQCFGGWVIDPDWHRSSIASLRGLPLHFKLHGWNSERWVRRYGVPRASRILRLLNSNPESTLILSYSGKIVEAPIFKV